VCALALGLGGGCFRGDFLDDTCEQLGQCTAAASTSTGPATGTTPPTTGDDTSTSTSTSTSSSGTGTGDGSSSGTTGEPPGILFEGPAFRIDQLQIVDPHLYISKLFCQDVTAFVNTGLTSSVQEHDSNVLLVAKDYDPMAATQTFLLYRDADCPLGEDYCVLLKDVLPTSFVSGNKDAGNCLDVQVSTVNPTNINTINIPNAPCVTSPTASVQLELTSDLSPITFYQGKFAAQYAETQEDPTELRNAILYGFIPKADAEMITYTFMNMQINFWSVIRGSDHPDACPVPADMMPGSVSDVDMLDLDADGPEPPTIGVFLYLNFSAKRVKFYAPF